MVPWLVVVAAWSGLTSIAAGQQRPVEADSTRGQILTTLRRFYFNLDHGDWEALTADILAAKVVAHRPVPEPVILGQRSDSSPADGESRGCLRAAPAVDDAVLALQEDWVEVVVPRCIAGPDGSDRFRLIRFENRWRFVYIQLSQDTLNLYTGR